MKHLTEELWFDVPTRRAFINITPQVEESVQQSGVQEGLCLVNAMHITASVFINDDESGLHSDTNAGWRNSRRMSPSSTTATTTPARIMPTPISSVR